MWVLKSPWAWMRCVLMGILFDVCARALVEAKVEELLAAGAWASFTRGFTSSAGCLFLPKICTSLHP